MSVPVCDFLLVTNTTDILSRTVSKLSPIIYEGHLRLRAMYTVHLNFFREGLWVSRYERRFIGNRRFQRGRTVSAKFSRSKGRPHEPFLYG